MSGEWFPWLWFPTIQISSTISSSFTLISNLLTLSPNKRPDTLHFFISETPNRFLHNIENFNDLHSDLSAVLLTLYSSTPIRFNNSYLVNKNTDWVEFNELLLINTKLNIKLKSPDDIEDAINSLNISIQSAAWTSLIRSHQILSSKFTHLNM